MALLVPLSVPDTERTSTALANVRQARDGADRFIDNPSEARDLLFEKNLGQWDPSLNFVSRADGYTAYLGSQELSLAFGQGVSVRMSYVDANPRPIVTGVGDRLAKTHYLIGTGQKTWHPNVPSFKQVRYEGLYPGIDLLYSGKSGLIQYDFIVRPGYEADVIKLRFDNETELRLDSHGRLLMHTNGEKIIFDAPLTVTDNNKNIY